MSVHTPKSDPGWIAWTAALAVAASAAALSFAALAELARVSGVPVELAPLLPITIDAGVLVSAKFWLTPGLAGRVTRFARTLTLSLIVVSSAGNVAGHWYAATPPQHFWLSALVSLVAPLTLAALAHLIVLARVPVPEAAPAALSPRRESHVDVVPGPSLEAPGTDEPVRVLTKPAPTPSQPRVAPPAQTGHEETRATADPRVDQLKAWIDELGEVPSQRRVIEKFSVHNNTAKKLIEAATVNGHKVI